MLAPPRRKRAPSASPDGLGSLSRPRFRCSYVKDWSRLVGRRRRPKPRSRSSRASAPPRASAGPVTSARERTWRYSPTAHATGIREPKTSTGEHASAVAIILTRSASSAVPGRTCCGTAGSSALPMTPPNMAHCSRFSPPRVDTRRLTGPPPVMGFRPRGPRNLGPSVDPGEHGRVLGWLRRAPQLGIARRPQSDGDCGSLRAQ
jgi:hypothetical protein